MLTEGQVRYFEALGFIVLRRWFSGEEIDGIGGAFDDVMEEARQGGRSSAVTSDRASPGLWRGALCCAGLDDSISPSNRLLTPALSGWRPTAACSVGDTPLALR